MPIPADSLSGTSVRDKVVTAAEAVRLVRDGDWVVVEGFMGQCFAEELDAGAGAAIPPDGQPARPRAGVCRRPGRPADRGLNRLCHEGLLKRAVGGHWGWSPSWGRWRWATRSRRITCRWACIAQLYPRHRRAAARAAVAGRPAAPSSIRGRAAASSTPAPPRTSSSCIEIGGAGVAALQGVPDRRRRSCAAPRRTPTATSPWSARR